MTQKPKALVFLPLGGTGEIGMNCNLYGFGAQGGAAMARKWIMVDLGVMFGGAETPGVDVITPDTSFIEQRRDDLLALFLTHGHQDHIGAVAHLWPRLGCPIYATPFTAALVQHKFAELGLEADMLHIIAPGTRVECAPFTVDYFTLTHSIAEPSGLAIRCGDHVVVHTGDWKIDDAPQIGDGVEREKLIGWGDDGVDAMVCDSTNALEAGRSGSEGDVADGLLAAVRARDGKGRVAITTFASNVARLQSIGRAAQASGRHITLAGPSLIRFFTAAQECGYLHDFPPILDEAAAASVARDRLMIICTGSQGEPNAALRRMVHGDHTLKLTAGDCVLFSSRVIPGNEKAIFALQNALVARDIEVLTADDGDLHVSGHPNRAELEDMYQWVRPRAAIPVHGEARHLAAHAALAAAQGVKEVLRLRNGDLVQLAPGPAAPCDRVEAGRYYIDGQVLLAADDYPFKTRQRVSQSGMIMLALAHDGGQLIEEPELRAIGLPRYDSDGQDLLARLRDSLDACLAKNPPDADGILRRDLRRAAKRIWGKSPKLEICLISV